MASKPLPPQGVLRQLLRYEPETGKLFWRLRPPSQFNSATPEGKELAARKWNVQNADMEAFTFSDRQGYRHGKIQGVKYQAHRVIWKLVNGTDPDAIDHMNGDTGDNRLSNLRDCTTAENSRNYKKAPGSTSKYRGVCWVKRDQKWAARISNGLGGKISLGNYDTEIAAAHAYDAAAMRLHGDFATLNFPSPQLSALEGEGHD